MWRSAGGALPATGSGTPYDHVHAGYARRLPDGSVGPGAVLRIKEFLGGDPRFLVDVESEIEKLDEEGFIHNPHRAWPAWHCTHGIQPGAACPAARNMRTASSSARTPAGAVRASAAAAGAAAGLPPGKGDAWLRHNIEEVDVRALPARAVPERDGVLMDYKL